MEFSISQILKLRRFKNQIIAKLITFRNSKIADIGGSAGLILGMSAFTIFLQIEGIFIKIAQMIKFTVDKVRLFLEIFKDFLTKCCRLCRRKYNRRKSRRQSRKFNPLSSSATSESFFSCSKSGSDPSYQKEESEGNANITIYKYYFLLRMHFLQ